VANGEGRTNGSEEQSGFAAGLRFPNLSRIRPHGHAHLVFVFGRCERSDAGDHLLQWPARGLGDDLEPIVLFDKAKPGEKVLIAVKLMHTVDKKNFVGATLKIDFSENGRILKICALNFFPRIAGPSVSKDVQPIRQVWRRPLAVDLSALDAKDQAKFDASLKQAQSTLEALKPTLQQYTLHLTGNSHIDAAWLWPWTETWTCEAHFQHRAAIDE